MMGSE